MRSTEFHQLFLLCLLAQSAFAQSSDDYSIPEPTELSTIASSKNSSSIEIGYSAQVAGGDSVAKFSAVRIDAFARHSRDGVQILIIEGDKVDQVLLDLAQAFLLVQELHSFHSDFTTGTTCTASHTCFRGVARCRPSQTEVQAICPSFYYKPDASHGIRISTPRHTFDFPYVDPAIFAEPVAAAIQSHPNIQRNRTALKSLGEARKRWESQDLEDYSLTLHRGGVFGGQKYRVKVRAGECVKVTYWRRLTRHHASCDNRTIPELFDELAEVIQSDPVSLGLEFDPAFGYPVYVSVEPRTDLTDQDWWYTISRFRD